LRSSNDATPLPAALVSRGYWRGIFSFGRLMKKKRQAS
jgi:hypothetical protein